MPKVLICPKCGYENNPANIRCSSCRLSFYPVLECPKCGEKTPPDLGECILCGYKFIVLKGEGAPAPAEEAMMKEAFKGVPELLEEAEKKPDIIKVPGPAKPLIRKVETRPSKPPKKAPTTPSLEMRPLPRLKRKRRGFINGLKNVVRHPASIPRNRRLKLRFIAIVVTVFVILSVIMIAFELSRRETIKIDGSFDDWNGVRKFDFQDTRKGAVDIISGASFQGREGLYLYIKVGDLITVGKKVLVSVFVDTDGNSATGYFILGTGADIRLDAQTDIGRGIGYRFQGNDQLLFNWVSSFSVAMAFSGSEIELGPISDSIHDRYRIVFTTVDDLSSRDVSDYPIYATPLITLEQKPLLGTLPSSERDVVEILATSHGGETTINSIEMEVIPSTLKVSPLTPSLPLTLGESPITLKVRADASQVQSGSFVNIKIKSVSASAPVYICGEELKGYAIAPPSEIKVDGAFDDWKKVTLTRHPVQPKVRDGLDITTTGKSNESDGLAILLGVRDNIFLGTLAPMSVMISGGGGGGGGISAPPPVGDDAAYILMDFDNGTLKLRADVYGKHGQIIAATLSKLKGDRWEKISSLDVGLNKTTMETLIPSLYIGGYGSVRISYQIFGWNDIGEGLLFESGSMGQPLPGPKSAPQFMYTPIASDISPGGFKVSWVSDQPVNASVEYCAYSPGVCDSTHFPGSPSIAYDALEFLPNGTALVEVKGLASGTQYFYRVKARNSGNEVSYSPSSSPYPSITTKTSTSFWFNPAFLIQPYHDVNNNYQYDSSVDIPQSYFLVYLNHTGAETLVGRGDPKMVVITASNLRDNDAVGDPHPLAQGDTVTFFVAGLYNDGGGTSYWVNTTASINLPWVNLPIPVYIRTESIPEFDSETLLPGILIVPAAAYYCLTGYKRRMKTHPTG